MKRTVSIAMFVIFLLSTAVLAQTLEDIKWYTEDYPPYNYLENDCPTGIAVDLLLAMWVKAGVNKSILDIKLVPWARGVRTIKAMPDTCLFSTRITAERKDIFGWKYVYPIPQASMDSNSHIIAKKSSKIRFNSIDDLKKYEKNFGVVRDDVGAAFLREAGVNVSKIDNVATPDLLIKKLYKGRHDVISYGFSPTMVKMKKMGVDPTDYEIVYTFPNRPLGYAFHHSTDPEIIKRFQKALNELYLDGTADGILQKYIKD